MNQDCHTVSSFTIDEYSNLVPLTWRSAVMDDLLHMHFKVTNLLTPSAPSAPIEVDNNDKDKYDFDELSPAEELTNTIATFGQWFESNNIADDICPGLVENISLIPAPHCCPIPQPCVHLHQEDALPCTCLHVDDIQLPLPCVRLHCDDKDIPMEPTTPTHVFSKAALQTPAPSLEASMPPSPPAAAAAAASVPPAGPCAHVSYPGAVAKNLNPAAPHFVCGPPCAPAQPPAQAQQPILSKCQFFIEAPNIPKDTSLPSMVKTANSSLACTKSTLQVDSACFTPCGITCATASVPTTSNLNIIGATLSSGLLGAHICILASQSFIKIVDVPFFKPGTTEPIPSTEVGAQLQHSIIPSNYVVHWHFIQNSPKAKFTTMWIDLSDLQRGT
ncbi:hypothetical protein P691DRAFT_783167 [Macrolepiota fuliginosa MF-IS2]|uniref:Uncharacterized protein n=1 Tax=Macrolepiota fuliginosa MF-IS2 TaxID=1400762 RepID=A0A9P5WXB4_9AGAR|nr:hypothetical protein P691DRAFT_783167 [Macrolepiota fuliginosa MF-IS2]